MNATSQALDVAAIRDHCKMLRLPTVGSQCERLAEDAIRERQSHLRYLDALLEAELDERERAAVERRIREAHFPRVKTLEEFDFGKTPKVSAAQIMSLAEGGYLARGEPVLFIGDCGTGKTHLATGLCVAACRQRKRVRFETAAGLVNELVEAQHFNQLGRGLARWSRFDLICIDEVGYVPLAELGAELLFQAYARMGNLRPGGAGGGDHYDQPAVLGMDTGVHQLPALQGDIGPVDGPGAHYRDRQRVLPLSQDA